MSRKVILLSLVFCSNDIFSGCCFKQKVNNNNNLSIKGNKSKKSKENKELDGKKEEEKILKKIEDENNLDKKEDKRLEKERKDKEEKERKDKEEKERKDKGNELDNIIKQCDDQLENASKYANNYNAANSNKALNDTKKILESADKKLNELIALKSNAVNDFKDKIKRLNERYEYISELINNGTIDISKGEKGYTAFLRGDRIVIFSKEYKTSLRVFKV